MTFATDGTNKAKRDRKPRQPARQTVRQSGHSALSLAPVGAVFASNAPNLFGEGGTARRRCRVNHFDSRCRLHRIGLAFHREHCCNPLRERSRTLACGVKLVRADAQPGALHHHTNNRVAGSTGPGEIALRVIVLVAVNVMHFDVARRAAENADARA